MDNAAGLEGLWKRVYKLNKLHFPDNSLIPIVGNGKTHKPRFMFVFINPTYRNISSEKDWKGPRFPFVGTRQVWRVFHQAGLFDGRLMDYISRNKVWSEEFSENVLEFLKKEGFYFTNLVKWTGSDATLPDSRKIELFLPILEEEIEIVQPEYIVTFGLMPFEQLTKERIRLGDYYSEALKNRRLSTFKAEISGRRVKVIPCYFPVGRGNPKRATEILGLLEKL